MWSVSHIQESSWYYSSICGTFPNYTFNFQFEMREPKMCQIVCKLTPNEKDAKDLKEKIEDEYHVNMYDCRATCCLLFLNHCGMKHF